MALPRFSHLNSLIRLLVFTPLPQFCWSLPACLVRLGAPGGGSIYTLLLLPPVLDHCVVISVCPCTYPLVCPVPASVFGPCCCLPCPCVLYPCPVRLHSLVLSSPACPVPSSQLSTTCQSLQSAWLVLNLSYAAIALFSRGFPLFAHSPLYPPFSSAASLLPYLH